MQLAGGSDGGNAGESDQGSDEDSDEDSGGGGAEHFRDTLAKFSKFLQNLFGKVQKNCANMIEL